MIMNPDNLCYPKRTDVINSDKKQCVKMVPYVMQDV